MRVGSYVPPGRMRGTPDPSGVVTGQASRHHWQPGGDAHTCTCMCTHQASSCWEFHIRDPVTSSRVLRSSSQEILTWSPEQEPGQGSLCLHEHKKPRLPVRP